MAYGYEVMLGFLGEEDCRAVAAVLGLELDGKLRLMEEEDFDEASFSPDQLAANTAMMSAINHLLDKAHQALIKSASAILPGFEFIRFKENRHFLAKTPTGIREFSTFDLELSFDPDGMGETPTKDAVLGVGLSGAYYPVFLDWRSPHGGLNTFVLNSEFEQLTALAKKDISARLPVFCEAEFVIKKKHY